MVMDTQQTTNPSHQARKYLFDLAFDGHAGASVSERAKPKQTYTEEQLEAAKKEAYQSGFNAGQTAAAEDQQQRLNVLLSQIDQRLLRLIEGQKNEWERQLGQLQEIALVIARKIMPRFVAEHGLDEVDAIVSKVITEMSREPRLVFRVNESQFDEAKRRIDAIAAQAAYAGKLVILGEAELGLSECRIEWADGGIERDVKTMWQCIDRVLGEVQTLDVNEPETQNPTATATPQPATVPEIGDES
ncbi:MAG TPA: hypothetical protein DCY07_05260 [Rhodospirillaceae bacterium]|nr:hypothetical protein [Rhodospirillaceae bacterium]